MGVFSDLKPKNRATRNGFDRSFRSVFSQKVGQILPVMALPTLPSSEYEIDLKQLLRTQPLQTAAFTGFSINYDFMFLPYNYMYQSFNQFLAQRENKQSTVQPSNYVIPTFNLGRFTRELLVLGVWDYIVTQVSSEVWFERVCYYLKARNASVLTNFASRDLPYCYIYDMHAPNQSVILNVIKSMDMLGYGNLLPLLKSYVDVVCNYIHAQLDPADFDGIELPTSSEYLDLFAAYVADFMVKQTWDAFYFVDLFCSELASAVDDLVLDIYGLTTDNYLQAGKSQYPTLWPAMAYQKFFHEYYRNSYYDTRLNFAVWTGAEYVFGQDVSQYQDYVYLFNFDDFVAPIDNFSLRHNSEAWDMTFRILAMFNLYPHLYRKDLLTAVLPSQQFGDVSTMVTDDNFKSLVAQVASGSTYSSGALTAKTGSTSEVTVNLSNSISTGTQASAKFKFSPALAISVLESRRADAMQRFKERMLRAGDKVDDIFESHGWSAPRSEKMYEPVFLGSFDGRLDINTVAATTESDNFEVGQLGANGVATVNGSKVRFKTTDFGIIMCVCYIVKDSEIDAYQLERTWQLTEAWDFPYPEFQNISLDAVTRSQGNNFLDYNNDNPGTDVIGYLPRYMEYKTSLDRVHGEFHSALPVGFKNRETLPRYTGIYARMRANAQGVFSDWVTPRKNLLDFKDLSYLYQQADCADNVFKVAATSRQDSDPFLINAYFDVKAVQPLTVIGLPI